MQQYRLYKLSEYYDQPIDVLNACRSINTDSACMDLKFWLRTLLHLEERLIVMKDHPFFGDQLLVRVADHNNLELVWAWDPYSGLYQSYVDRVTLEAQFRKKIFKEWGYTLREAALSNSFLTYATEGQQILQKVKTSLQKVTGTEEMFILNRLRLRARYFCFDSVIYCALQRIVVMLPNKETFVLFDFEQISRNYEPSISYL